MKDFILQKFNIIIVCITIMVVSIAGFSFAYATDENTIYTRDELSEKVYDTGWVALSPYFAEGAVNYTENRSRIRRIGSVVYLMIDVTEVSVINGEYTYFINNLPEEFRPVQTNYVLGALGSVGGNFIRHGITNNGFISTSANSYKALPSTTRYLLYHSYLAN